MRNLLFVLLVSLCSCTTIRVIRPYTGASYGSLKSYVAQPEYSGEDVSATYISADIATSKLDYNFYLYNESESRSYSYSDKKTIFSVSLHKALAREHFNFHYGVGGSYGKYTFADSIYDAIKPGDQRNFYSIDARSGINLLKSSPKVDFRIIGLEMAFNHTFGPYEKTLTDIVDSQAQNYDRYGYEVTLSNKSSLLSANLNSEVIFKLSERNSLGVGIFLGTYFISNDRESKQSYGAFLSYRYSKYTVSALGEYAPFNELYLRSIKFGLAYRLF